MILPLVKHDDPILKEVMPQFDFANPPCDPIELAKNLTETMIANNGLGLSANQTGLRYRVFALNGSPVNVCFNPRIVDETKTNIILMDEGCLSFPNLYVKVKRPRTIKVRYTMPNGETVTQKFDGITARCFMHELDHLNGIVFTSRANQFHLEKALKRKKLLERGQIREERYV
jgi:peptide deformylase